MSLSTRGRSRTAKLDAMIPSGNDLLEGLKVDVPDIQSNQKLLEKIRKDKEARDEADAARAQLRKQLAKEAANRVIESGKDDMTEVVTKMKEQLQAVGALEFLEDEQVLFPTHIEEKTLSVESNFKKQAAAACSSLGLKANDDIAQEVFRQAVLSGFLRTQLTKSGECPKQISESLFTLIAYSTDIQLAGAAFVTLLYLMNDEKLPSLSLESIALPIDTAAEPVKLAAVPGIETIVQALAANGYQPGSGGGDNKKKTEKEEVTTKKKKNSAEEGDELRLQTIKMLVHTAAAVSRYCQKNPAAAKSSITTSSITDLIIAVLHMGIDPIAVRIQEDLDTTLPYLLSALPQDSWSRCLPDLAERVVKLGPSTKAHLRVIKSLPVAHPRGFSLQQAAAALLLSRTIPGSKSESLSITAGVEVHPMEIFRSQPWFKDPKGLVAGATSGGQGKVPKGGYFIGEVEILLNTCDAMLWPHALPAAMGDGRDHGNGEDAMEVDREPLDDEFVKEWTDFLCTVAKSIKNLQPEDQYVRGLATQLDLEYKAVCQQDLLMGMLASP